jgi:hypothetical protein
MILSIILLQWTQSFAYSKLSHFAIVNSAIIEVSSVILLEWTQSFYYNTQLCCAFIIHFCYSKLGHFSTMISHFMILLVIFEILLDILL